MNYIFVLFFLFFSLLHAETNQSISKTTEAKIAYHNEVIRSTMLREGKYLTKKYEDALLKLENWTIQKAEKKREFYRQTSKEEITLGPDNAYGKKRAQKRRYEFYNSLQRQEEHIKKRVANVEQKLQDLNDEFYLLFSVPLTHEEMYQGIKPKVMPKEESVVNVQEHNLSINSEKNSTIQIQ
ncbi:MAG: hypothetical protein K0U47_04725 [Epsilonproteobacteria bacterium]|nr:hypothetical protein [Campylobacterota bacterium]